MKGTQKGTVGLFRAVLIYQIVILFIVLLFVNLGILIFLKKEVIKFAGEELSKRNTLLQLTLKDAFRPDLPPPEQGDPVLQPPLGPDYRNEMVMEALDFRIRRACSLSRTRFTVISAEGQVNFDSDFPLEDIGNQSHMPEIAALISGAKTGLSVREDRQTSGQAIFQALPLLGVRGELMGFTRVSQPLFLAKQLHDRILQSVRLSNLMSLIVILLIIVPYISNLVSLVKELERCALEISRNNFDQTLPSSGLREFASLISAMDHMSRTLKKQISLIEEQSLVDELTGLGNRRMFNQKLEDNWWLCVREKHPISLLILDIDKFKQYNDTLGHPAGDECLKKISGVLRKTVNRHTDILVRIGGEEFGILLSEEEERQARMLSGKILKAVNDARIPHPDSPVAPHVTISIGMATLHPQPGDDRDSLFELADRALYRAKEGGRNRAEK